MGQEIADIIGNTIYCCLEFFFRKGTATESSLHCKQSNRFYLFVYADAGRNKIRILAEKQNSFGIFRIGEKHRRGIRIFNRSFFRKVI